MSEQDYRQFVALIRTATNAQLKALSAKLLRELGAVQRELAHRAKRELEKSDG
jgi:hypothetical protein